MKFFKNKQVQVFCSYATLILAITIFIFLFVKNAQLNDFISTIENKTFDLRQSILTSPPKKTNKDIVIIKIDDPSYEYLLNRYGEWPIPRNVYADLVTYLEQQHPKSIAFDLMFIKSLKSKQNADAALVNAVKKYDNVFLSMNLDNIPADVRTPINLPKKFAVNVENDSKINFTNNLTFSNCRPILSQLMDVTDNVGMINVIRQNDGILREMPPFMVYKNQYYPYLALKVGANYLNAKDKDFKISKNGNFVVANRTIPINSDGSVILNWYGPAGKTFTEISFYKLLKAANGEENLNFNFKNKIIYIGTTAVGLSDAKSVPVDKLYPGVEMHATFINNLIDNNFIKKTSRTADAIISLVLAVFIGILVFRISSTFVALATTIITALGYTFASYFIMKYFNLWIAIVIPVTAIIVVFIATYIIKYILKSRDFEHQYKLATTDGLTELYNHRYFQEQMIQQIATCKRYNTNFSMIIIDIDFFKKFNDNFGHQSGDAVLKQVAHKLKKNVRATDIVCRYGGEEMTIILPNADKEEAVITAKKICQVIAEKPFKLANNQESKVTISLGVSTFPEDGETPAQIIEKADKCLYYAKENGRNQVGKID